MPLTITACIHIFVAVAAGWGLCRLCLATEHRDLLRRVALSWLALTAITFFAKSPLTFFAPAAVVLLFLAPRAPTDRLGYFCAVLPAAPFAILWSIPFPGINYLYEMSYPDLASLLLLAPVVAAKSAGEEPSRAGAPFTFGLLFLGLCIILDLRDTTVTNGLRLALGHLLTFGLLVLALKRHHTDPRMRIMVPVGLLMAGVMLGFVGLMQAYTRWTIYDVMSAELFGVVRAHIALMREGGFRLPGTQDPIPYGIMMAVSLGLCYWSYCQTGRTRALAHLGAGAMLLYTVIGSDSRGAILGVGVMAVAFVLYSRSIGRLRKGLMLLLTTAAAVGFLFMGLGDYLLSFDTYDTFTYRLDLITVSSQAIAEQPFFGSRELHPIMEQMRNDSGIIDIVNAYLQIALQYGLTGLILFVVPALISLRYLAISREAGASREGDDTELGQRALLASAAAFLLAIGTVSMVGVLPQYYWIIIGFAATSMQAVGVDTGVASRGRTPQPPAAAHPRRQSVHGRAT